MQCSQEPVLSQVAMTTVCHLFHASLRSSHSADEDSLIVTQIARVALGTGTTSTGDCLALKNCPSTVHMELSMTPKDAVLLRHISPTLYAAHSKDNEKSSYHKYRLALHVKKSACL